MEDKRLPGKISEAEEQKDAPEELAKDEMIRQILREFMA